MSMEVLQKLQLKHFFVTLMIGGVLIFFFVYVPKPPCTMLRDPSGVLSNVCAPSGPSLYQKLFLMQHAYFYPNDTCVINIETRDIDCRPFPQGCDQSATTTDCSTFAPFPVPATTVPSTAVVSSSSEMVWKTYENKDLGISFAYPTGRNSNDGYWGIGNGTTGKAFQATIGLPSGAVIYAYATTKDYSVEKGGFSVGTEGFIVTNRKYHVISRGNPVNTAFVPDEVWELSDGSGIPVLYGKKYDPALDYPDAAVKAMVNILPNVTFTGIGFVLWNMNDAGSHSASFADIAIFKKIVTSIKFVKALD